MSYSGGTVTVTGDQCPQGHTRPYGPTSGGWGGGGTTGVCPDHEPPPLPGPGTVTCQGAVTATLTWIPQGLNDPVPSVVIVRKESTAGWSGGAGGSCANGLGHPEVEGVSTGVKFEVLQNPTSPIVVTIAPSADVHYWPPPAADVGTANVLVKVSAIVPKLTFEGHKESTTPVGKRDNILVGQRLTSTVALGGLPQGSQDTFTWSASAGSPFNAYTTTPTLGKYYAFAPPSEPSASWHFASGMYGDPSTSPAGRSSTVKCTVTLREPEPDLTFSVEREVRIFEPQVQAPLTMTFGTVQMFGDPLAPTHLVLIGLPWPNGNEVGAIWEAELLRVPFFDQPGDPYERGKWGVFQLAVGRLEWQRAADSLRKNQNFDLWGLDLGVPYAGLQHELDGENHRGSDTPGIGVLGVAGTLWAKIDYEFATALMFRPPGGSSVWVPLQAPIAWFAKGTATNTPPWVLSGNGQGLASAQFPVRYFFNWTRAVQDGLYWVPPWP